MENRRKNGKSPYIAWMAGAALLILLLSVVLGRGIWKEYVNAIVDNQKEQMLLTVESLSDSVEVFIEEYEADLNSLRAMTASSSKEKEGLPEELLKQYVESHSLYVSDILVEREDGSLLQSVRGSRVQEQYSESKMDESFSLCQCRMEDGTVDLILKQKKAGELTISLVIDTMSYYQSMISGLRVGSNGYVVVKDSRGIILMHPEQLQWGIDVIEGRQEMYPGKDLSSLSRMIERQNRGEEGVEEYYSYWWTKPGAPRVKKISAFCPARIGEDFLVVSAVIDYDEIYIPVKEGFLKVGLIYGGVVAVLLIMAFYLVKFWVQKKSDKEEIAYLTELNRILEDMHRSEETIAHQQRLQIMGTMTGGIAHEFNNLLTPIMGYSDLLMMDLPEDSEQYDNASEIYEAAAKAKEMIQQISSLSRKNMETAYKTLNAKRVLLRALKMVRSVCPSNVHLVEEISLTEEVFLGNETQFNQVILNIGVNAIHAIGHEDGTITVQGDVIKADELEAVSPAAASNWKQYIRIRMTDNGCGMSKEVLSQIFDPFFTTKKGGQGTGLGLSLVEQIVASHRGYIAAESTPGEGSTFALYFPLLEKGNPEEKSGDTGAKEDTLRLLLIDDNPKVLRLLEKSFHRLHTPLTACVRFEEAREKLKEESYDAVIAGQTVAGRSAIDFFLSLSGQYPDMIRLVMADRITKELAEARQRGMLDGYLEKPVSETSILEALKNLNKF